MSYFYGLVVVFLFFSALHYFTALTMVQKLGVTAGLLLLVGGAVAYDAYAEKQRAHIREVEVRYGLHETLQCNGMEVNDTNYSYSVGTQSFIGREGTANAGRIISAVQCR